MVQRAKSREGPAFIRFWDLISAGHYVPLRHFEGFYLRQNSYPRDATNYWNPDDTEVQGVTNDGENWFFTVTPGFFDGNNGWLWRIPKSDTLTSPYGPPGPGVIVTSMMDIDELADHNYWHWGDPDHHRHNGIDYILVPIPGPIVACFRADNLEYINYAHLNANYQNYAGWCAVSPNGDIYSSSNHPYGVVKYHVNWDSLIYSNNQNAITFEEEFFFRDENGLPIQLFHMQGGEFSDSGELLYVISGSAGCDAFGWFGPTFGPGEPSPTDGIHVFETVHWKEIKRSVNAFDNNQDYFSYTFNNGCTCLSLGSQTPEGLTIWDLDDGSAPNISGQLHVILNHYNINIFCNDAITMHHYSNNIHVDEVNGFSPPIWGNPIPGTISKPFKTINEAYNYYPIWDGAQMVIKAGIYNDTGFYSKRIRMTSAGGTVIIGQQ